MSDDRQLDILSELELERDEDAPMSMAAHLQVSHIQHYCAFTIIRGRRVGLSCAA